MTGPKNPDNVPVHPGIIEQENEKRRKKEIEEQPTIPLENPDMPDYDPEKRREWEKKKEREKKDSPDGGVIKIDLL